MLFRETFENTSAIINNFSQHLIGLFCLQTKEAFLLVIKITFCCKKNISYSDTTIVNQIIRKFRIR